MKSLIRITLPGIAVILLILFGVVPGMNKNLNTNYSRKFEDTDSKSRSNLNSKKAVIQTDTARKKVYKKERLAKKWSKVRPRAFSRSAHFIEELPIVLTDSLEDLKPDSSMVAF